MTKLIYLEDSYKKSVDTGVTSIIKKGDHYDVILEETVFYPEGGGQPSDRGEIAGRKGKITVVHCRMQNGDVVHEGKLEGALNAGEKVTASIDWELRYDNMRWHSAGHILHDATMQTIPMLIPIRGEHGKHAYIEYQGSINEQLRDRIEKEANLMIAQERQIKTELVSFEELIKRATWVPDKLPKNKPLRILQIEGCNAIPDGGTQVKNTSEVKHINVTEIENLGETVRVHYAVIDETKEKSPNNESNIQYPNSSVQAGNLQLDSFRNMLLSLQTEILEKISESEIDLEKTKIEYFGSHGHATNVIKKLKEIAPTDKKAAGMLVNQFKQVIEEAFSSQTTQQGTQQDWFDVSLPGIKPPMGHLHIVTQAISEITRIFERIGFTRVRHPEVDWDWYPFESLNMPHSHPASDEWETFFIESDKSKVKSEKFSKIVLTPHTSNGQVREMEKGKLPIRMINIAKCYRRQSDVSHVPMFHQFEGLYVDKNVSIGHLKGVLDYFVKQFFGPERKARIRPFHFQFTEPSFEIDISCDVCGGKGCKLCKEGWLELGGAGMVHPVVLKNGGVNTDEYNGFAFGWGVERTYMMKAGTKLDDIRLLYSNDVRFLEQF